MTDEEQIKELYIRYWQYMIDKDADGLMVLCRICRKKDYVTAEPLKTISSER